MRALELDFARTPARFTWVGVSALLLAALLALDLYVRYGEEAGQLAQAQERLERLQARTGVPASAAPAPRSPAATQQTAQEMSRANLVLAHLALPWNELFTAIETATPDDIALLSLQPNTKTGRVQIGGEARTTDVMLDYLRRLEATPQLRQVLLVNHKIVEEVAERPIQFSLTATWARR